MMYGSYNNNGGAFASAEKKPPKQQKKQKKALIQKGKAFIIEYLEEGSIHGLIYLARVGLHFTERVLWLAFVCICCFSIFSLGNRIWERFQTSPIVISMDRNKFVWNTSFPSLTVCPHKRVDEDKMDGYIEAHPNQFETERDKTEFKNFMTALANMTYENIDNLPMNNTFGIKSNDYLDLLYELKWEFGPEISSGTTVKMYMDETITELGLCHSVNSLIAKYNSYEYWKSNRWNNIFHADIVTVHPLDGEIYAQIINLSTSYDVYFHGASEIPDISKQRYTFFETDYTNVELTALEIRTSSNARAFSVQQRKCRFPYEFENLVTSPVYSFGICRTECRMKIGLQVCNCIPHFYRNRWRSGRVLPVCDFEGLQCLNRIRRDIISLKSDTLKIDCNCQANCEDSNFFVQSYRSRVWFLGANLQWGISDYPKMQLVRDVLFSFADVLVYIGGLAGFFLGCSLLSFTEFIYFFSIRMINRLFT